MVGNVPKIRAMINAHSSLPAVAPTAPAGLQIAVRLDARVRDKADAIAQAALLLQDRGCVAPGYATGMQAREAQAETRSEEHTSELQSQSNLVCRLLLEKKKTRDSPLSQH